ncbi:hypothetical protein Sjap_011059 [Stephania japonica]|uniref:Uncharacterized protein n=1 Tax=Stephania japonica TaxID=461633 RepID=A0AAP0JAC8_9MAGN
MASPMIPSVASMEPTTHRYIAQSDDHFDEHDELTVDILQHLRSYDVWQARSQAYRTTEIDAMRHEASKKTPAPQPEMVPTERNTIGSVIEYLHLRHIMAAIRVRDQGNNEEEQDGMRWGLGGFTPATEKTRGLAMFECYSLAVLGDFVIDSWTGWLRLLPPKLYTGAL